MPFKARTIAAAVLSLGLAAGGAKATITVHTSAFIGTPTAYNGFEHIPEGFGVPYVEQGIAVRYVTDQDYNIFSSVQAYEGEQSFYAYAVAPGLGGFTAHGYTDIMLLSGEDFGAIQFAEGSGFIDSGGVALNFQLLKDGVVVQSGVAGPVPDYQHGFNLYGFSGGGFDEVRLQVNDFGAFDPSQDEAGDIDAITVGNVGVVPEPNAWALMIAGFGLAGATLRVRRRVASAA